MENGFILNFSVDSDTVDHTSSIFRIIYIYIFDTILLLSWFSLTFFLCLLIIHLGSSFLFFP